MNCISLILTYIDEKLKLVKSLNWNVHVIYQWHEIIVWLVEYWLTSSDIKGSIADEGPLHLGLCLTFMPFEQGGVFIVTHLLGRCFSGVIKRLLLSLGLWVLGLCFNLDPHGTMAYILICFYCTVVVDHWGNRCPFLFEWKDD